MFTAWHLVAAVLIATAPSRGKQDGAEELPKYVKDLRAEGLTWFQERLQNHHLREETIRLPVQIVDAGQSIAIFEKRHLKLERLPKGIVDKADIWLEGRLLLTSSSFKLGCCDQRAWDFHVDKALPRKANDEAKPAVVDSWIRSPLSAPLRWLYERVHSARARNREIVRLYLEGQEIEREECIYHLGDLGDATKRGYADGVEIEGPYVRPEPAGDWTKLRGPRCPPGLIVEGYFVGEKKVVDDDYEIVSGSDWHAEWPFHIFNHRVWKKTKKSDRNVPQYEIVLTGPDAAREIQPIEGSRKLMLVAGSFAIADQSAKAEAEKLKAELLAHGFPQAEVIDSRQAAKLTCCFYVVVVGRYGIPSEAESDLAKLKILRPDAALREALH